MKKLVQRHEPTIVEPVPLQSCEKGIKRQKFLISVYIIVIFFAIFTYLHSYSSNRIVSGACRIAGLRTVAAHRDFHESISQASKANFVTEKLRFDFVIDLTKHLQRNALP